MPPLKVNVILGDQARNSKYPQHNSYKKPQNGHKDEHNCKSRQYYSNPKHYKQDPEETLAKTAIFTIATPTLPTAQITFTAIHQGLAAVITQGVTAAITAVLPLIAALVTALAVRDRAAASATGLDIDRLAIGIGAGVGVTPSGTAHVAKLVLAPARHVIAP